jgi:septal ring factor EnvC (AmiA/AmiB activator)
MRFLYILVLIFFIFVPDTQAQSPVPYSHPMKEIEGKLKDRQKREKALKAELKSIKSGLKSKQKEMVGIARDIKNNEKSLIKLEGRIEEKEEEQFNIEARLKEDRGAISDLILAMERMRRVPPEALLARPGAPLETAQSAMLLESILPRVHKRAEGLKADMDVLANILTDLKQDRASVMKTSKQLEISHRKLSKLLSERENLFAKTAKDVKKEQAELKRISLQASNLRDLVARIEKKQREADKRRAESFTKKHLRRTPIPKTGQAQLPISGLIKVGYGKYDDIGAVSEGLKIKSRANALVVAPMGGVVDFAGYFKGYGEIIILKHQKGYHSLIAGLAKIDTVVGRAVTAGEPIGKMGEAINNEAPILYYELRYKGNPVNPSKKISGLK